MEVLIYSSIKAIVTTDIVKDIVAIQKGQKTKRKSARDFKNSHILPKCSRGPQVQESAAGVMYLSMRKHPKATFLSGSRKGVIGA